MTSTHSRLNLLSEADLAAFRRDGFVVVRGMFDGANLQAITRWTDELVEAPDRPGWVWKYYENSLTEPGKRVLSRIENFCTHHAGFDQVVQGPRMLAPIEDLFGEPAVLFKDKINMKMPGGAGFTPHQDVQAGWDAYAALFVTMLVSIDATTAENGCLELAPAYHDRGMIGALWKPLGDDDMRGMNFVSCPTEPGDVVFFDSFAPHRSGPNLTQRPRRVLYITYNRAAEGDHRAAYYADKRKNFPPEIEREPGKVYEFKV